MCYLSKNPRTTLFFERLGREPLRFKEASELPGKNRSLGCAVPVKKVRIGSVKEHCGSDDFVENKNRDGHHGLGIQFGATRISGGFERVHVDRLFSVYGIGGDRAFACLQTRVAKALGHPSISFSADQLVGGCEMPDIGATYGEVIASAATERLKNFRRRKRLGGGTGELKQELLKGAVFSGSNRRRSQYLFGSRTSPRDYASHRKTATSC